MKLGRGYDSVPGAWWPITLLNSQGEGAGKCHSAAGFIIV
jgi:hypothetical protein